MKKQTNKPNIFAWWFYTFCSRIMLLFKNHIKYDRLAFKKRNKKEGCLVIYNHQSNQDHFVTTASFKYTRTNYVITKHFYFNKTLRKVLSIVKAIPRDQFKSDLVSIKKMKKVVDESGIVSIAPAGQITVNGQMPYIDKAICKLAKFLKVDVYALQMYGTYLACPKWGKNKRRFPIKTKFVKVLSKEDLSVLSDDEIYEKLIQSININDRAIQKQTPKKIKGKNLIEGLEQIIYYCPKCKSKHTMITSGNTMLCTACGNKVIMNRFGFLEKGSSDSVIYDDEAKWYHAEKELIKKEILDGSFYLEEEFTLYKDLGSEFKLSYLGTGRLVLKSDSFYFEGSNDTEKFRIDFPINNLIQLPFDLKGRLDIPSTDGTYQFRPTSTINHIIEYVQAIDVMREERC